MLVMGYHMKVTSLAVVHDDSVEAHASPTPSPVFVWFTQEAAEYIVQLLLLLLEII